MAKLASILKNDRDLTINLGDGEPLQVTYQPGAVTPETEDAFMSKADSQRGGLALAQFLCSVLTAWDLVGDDGKVYPITEKGLRKLPIAFLGMVVTAITNDMRPNPQNAATSHGGSLAAG